MKFDVGILASQPLPVIVRQVQLAESLGFDTAWIADTHLVCRELWVTLAACAAGTSRIRLGPGIAVPHTRHISVTASAIATLHELAEGRVVIGIGTGGSAAETMGLSVGKVARIATLESMAASLRRLLGRESIRLDNGTDARLAWLERAPAIPLYLAGSGPPHAGRGGAAGRRRHHVLGGRPLAGRGRARLREGRRAGRRARPGRALTWRSGPRPRSRPTARSRGTTCAAAWPPRSATRSRSRGARRTRR